MRTRQPAALDVRSIFTAAHDAIESNADPDLWRQFITEAFVPSGWHDKPADEDAWYWHASSLCQCPREAILKRARLDTDGQRLESKSAFMIGHTYHALGRFGMHMLGQYEDVLSEVGGHHPTLPLAALADTAYRFADEWTILEWKTESEFAGKHRREEAIDGSSARHEHRVQVTAQAMVLEALHLTGPIENAWIAYIGKESGSIDQQPVEITEELRREVVERIGTLEDAWERWIRFQTLPPMLPDEEKRDRSKKLYMAPAWQCRARSETDGRGMYCSARTACFARKEK